MKKLKFIALCGASIVSVAAHPQQPDNVRFGMIADIQYCDCDAAGNRYYRNSPAKLAACVDDLNSENVEFTVNLGDLVDRDPENNLDTVLDLLDRLNGECYNTTGNHDYTGIDNETLYARLGMPAPYYSFTRKGWRFIMLNTNEVAAYSNISGTPLQEEFDRMMAGIRDTGRKNGAPYNGGISDRQLEWLESELETAEKNGEKAIVFSHHPIYAAAGLTALNDLEILDILTSFTCVKAVISGHHHPGHFGVSGGIPFITMQGMIETETQNAYGTVELFPDKIVVTGKGRAGSYEFGFR